MEKRKKRGFNPHAYVLLVVIVIVCAIMTWVIPAGEFDTYYDEELDRNITIAGSYHTVESSPVTIGSFLTSFYNGFCDSADIIFFILFAASYVALLSDKGCITSLTGAMLRKFGNKDIVMIPIFMILFGLGGSFIGMWEETYALMPVFVVIFCSLGYDRIVGGGTVLLGVGIGFSAAMLNPFTIGVASSVAEVPLVTTETMIFRIITFIVFEGVGIWFMMRYAKRIKADPSKSILYGDPKALEGLDNMASKDEMTGSVMTKQQKIALILFLVLIAILVYGVIVQGWYFAEMGTLFLVFFVITGIIFKMKSGEIADAFVDGSKNALYGALLVGVARAVCLVMEDGMIIDTCVNALANLVSNIPASVNGIGMVLVQNIINFFIPSGSGQAVVVMPIMAPVADILGQSREVAVVAYQFGDGFSNMLWPTSVATDCAIIGIGLDKWYKFFLPLFGIIFLLQCVFICVAVAIGL